MEQQRRCLTGMANGLPVAAVAGPNFTVLHTLAASSTAGLAELDVVELYVHNANPADPAQVNVAFVTPANAALTFLTYEVPAGSSVKVFDEDAFGGPLSGLGGNKIVVNYNVGEGLSTDVSAWGWFVRTRG